MNKRKRMVFAALVLLPAVIFTAACNRAPNAKEDVEWTLELRSYTVPAEYASEVTSIINDLLAEQATMPGFGKAHIGPGGVVIVAAPASVQSGIQKMIADIGEAKPEPPPMVSLTYWIVVGSPAKESAWPSQLNEIEPVLKAVSASEGPMYFAPQERLKVQSMSGEPASLSGDITSVRQRATVRQGNVLGDITISLAGAGRDLNTKVQMALNNVLVLGQSGCPQLQLPRGVTGIKCEPESEVFYIVRADAEPGRAR